MKLEGSGIVKIIWPEEGAESADKSADKDVLVPEKTEDERTE